MKVRAARSVGCLTEKFTNPAALRARDREIDLADSRKFPFPVSVLRRNLSRSRLLAHGEAAFLMWGVGDGLTKAETYRAYAAECLGLSKIANDERNSAVLCRIAVAWINLADTTSISE
jgi:hypothetical protein